MSSTYMQYLPAPFQGDELLGRFLGIFESILAPIEETIDGVAEALDPRLAPDAFLPWLASWTGVELDEHWPVAAQRELIARAAELHRWRGTRRGLREHLRLYTGEAPLIVENFSGLRLGQDACLGVNTRLGRPHAHCVYVTALAAPPAALDEGVLRRILEADTPAHVDYRLEVRPLPGAPEEPIAPGERGSRG
jgi:phage tail-like protein